MSDKLKLVINNLNTIFERLYKIDLAIEVSILNVLQDKYYPAGDLPLFTTLLPKSVKLIFYFSIASIVFFIIKIIYPEKRIVTLTLISILLIMGVLLVSIFLGFMQLLYE